MGNSSKKTNQATDEKKDETQAQTAENQQTENPEQTDSDETQPPVTPPAGETSGKDEKAEEKKVKLTLRHKSHTQHYYRCGLMLTKAFAEYEVSEEAAAKIKADKWIEVKGSK